MSIVRTVKRAGRAAGKVLDPEDRRFVGQLLILASTASAVVIGGAATIGVAVRVFNLALG